MRFEAKHQHLKSQAKIMYSRKNICYSFAKKICFQNASNNLNNSNLLKTVKEYSKSKEGFKKGYESLLLTFIPCSRINLNGTLYLIGDYIPSDSSDTAYKILQIAVDNVNDKVMFLVEKFALKYVQSLRSFKLCESLIEVECHDSSHFVKPPINLHLFENYYYLRKEEF